VSYIIDLLKGTIEPIPDRISLERYVQESAFVTRYLSRIVKDKALVVYQDSRSSFISLGSKPEKGKSSFHGLASGPSSAPSRGTLLTITRP